METEGFDQNLIDSIERNGIREQFDMPTLRLHQRFLDVGYQEKEPLILSYGIFARRDWDQIKKLLDNYEVKNGDSLRDPIFLPAEIVPESRAACVSVGIDKKVYALYSR